MMTSEIWVCCRWLPLRLYLTLLESERHRIEYNERTDIKWIISRQMLLSHVIGPIRYKNAKMHQITTLEWEKRKVIRTHGQKTKVKITSYLSIKLPLDCHLPCVTVHSEVNGIGSSE